MSIVQICECPINLPFDENGKLIPKSIEISHINQFIKCLNEEPGCREFMMSRLEEIENLVETKDVNYFHSFFDDNAVEYIEELSKQIESEQLVIESPRILNLTDKPIVGGTRYGVRRMRRNPSTNVNTPRSPSPPPIRSQTIPQRAPEALSLATVGIGSLGVLYFAGTSSILLSAFLAVGISGIGLYYHYRNKKERYNPLNNPYEQRPTQQPNRSNPQTQQPNRSNPEPFFYWEKQEEEDKQKWSELRRIERSQGNFFLTIEL